MLERFLGLYLYLSISEVSRGRVESANGCQGQRRSAQTDKTASSGKDVSGSASWSSAESTEEDSHKSFLHY